MSENYIATLFFLVNQQKNFFLGGEILADLLMKYYTDYEPESIFIAKTDNRMTGYLLGCKKHWKTEKNISDKNTAVCGNKIIFEWGNLQKKESDFSV